jgi:surface protein
MNLDTYQIRFNGFEIGMIRWNGYVLYNSDQSSGESGEGSEDDISLYVPGEFRGDTTITEARTMVNGTHNNLSNMFEDCTRLVLVDTTNWDTSNVSDMSEMFKNCISLKRLDLSSFVTSNHSVGIFNGMFFGCSSLETLDIRNFYLNYYDSEEGYMAQSMFEGCESLKEIYMNNCNAYTIKEIISSLSRPSSGTGSIYVNRNNLTLPDGSTVTAPSRWRFRYV